MPVRVTYILKESLNWNIVLFPGVVFHELSHFVMSIFMGSRVTGGRFWGEKEAAITHEEVPGIRGYLISSAPFLFGTLAVILFLYLAKTGTVGLSYRSPWQSWFQVLVLYYLALSIAAHCFPSSRDASNAMHNLSSFYSRKASMQDGVVQGVFWLLTVPFIFFPLYLGAMIMGVFSTVRNLGFLWFVLLFWLVAAYL
ncbi:MAG: hypothetical protein KAW41_01110 [Candidatus Diapherotrites archaeon]|nr:hypothetical protein [Candidatus Diapherotrites archaeon]